MINFDALTLKLFYKENNDFFINAKIQKIQQPSRSELIFYIRKNHESKKFYINFNPNFYHLCFMSEENEERRNLSIPKSAPMFCMLLRKYILNSKIIKVDVPKYERIFEIYFEYYNEINEKIKLCLAIELMGKFSNVILYNYDTNVIIGCAHNVSSEKSRERELYGMLPYVYPIKQKKKNLLKVNFDSFKIRLDNDNISKSISENYHYLTTVFVQDLISSMNDFSFEKLYESLQKILLLNNYSPCILSDYSKYYVINFENSFNCTDINSMIDNYFSYHQAEFFIYNLKSKINKIIVPQIKKLNLLKVKQQQQIKKLDKALFYKTNADIIMANLYSLKQGIKKAELFDFEGNAVVIDFDEKYTPKENANRYYALYKKTKNAFEHASIMIEETDAQILYFNEIKYYTDKSFDIDELQNIYNELSSKNDTKDDKSQKIDFIESNGFKIYIGKNKKQNDYILSKLSSSEDIWFHPLNIPGAHVLIKINNSKETVSDDVILTAAKLTKEFSSQQNNSKTSIIYTKRKYVKKASNKQAFVTYKNETEIIV